MKTINTSMFIRKAISSLLFLLMISFVLNAKESLHYVISNDSNGQIIATETTFGKIIFSGENAARVINQAIQSIPYEQGGEIRIRSGRYNITESILIDRHGVTLSGDGRKTSTYGGTTYLISDKDIDMLIIHKYGERLRGVTIRDISFFGSGRSNGKSGIHAKGCSDLMVISNVGVYHCETGIYLQGGFGSGAVDAAQLQFIDPQQCGRGLVLDFCHYTKIFGGEFSDNYCESLPQEMQNGITLTSSVYGKKTIGTKIVGITSVRSAGSGIMIGKGTEDISVVAGCDLGGNRNNGLVITNENTDKKDNNPAGININGIMSYNNKGAGIKVTNASNVLITGCIVSVNEHDGVTDNGQDYGILIGKGVENIKMGENLVYGNAIQSTKVIEHEDK
jgi:hypothetical protein